MRVGLLDFLHLLMVVIGTVVGAAVNVPFGLWATVKGGGVGFILGHATKLAIHMAEGLVVLGVVGKEQARRQRVRAAWKRRSAAERVQPLGTSEQGDKELVKKDGIYRES